jgi:glutathione S-transferase
MSLQLFFQNAGVGPMQGQANHFLRYNLSMLPEDYSRERYINETRRLYRTLDKHLQDAKSDYLVGDKCTIADIAISSWANIIGTCSSIKMTVRRELT